MSYIGRTTNKSSDIRRFNATSSTSATHTLTWTAPNEQSLLVTINGVKQQEDAYSVSGTILTLTSALVSTDKLEVIGINDLGTVITPAQNSVDTDKIQDDAVTADKLATGLANATHTGDVTGATALTIAADAVDIAMLSATGTASSSTVLHGDNTWAEITSGTSWQAVKTAAFTAVAGNGYPINTTSAEITVTLPASASVGDTIEFVDYAGTFNTNNILINPNGLNIRGQSGNLRFKTEREGAKIVYVDATQGWLAVTSRTDRTLDPEFSGSGGTKTTNGIYTVHTFLTSSNFVVVGSGNVDMLCVAGAGGGAAQHGGAGGAGGYRYLTSVALTQQTYAIVVGAGGAGGSGAGSDGTVGNVSSGLTYSSAGGGYGGAYPNHAGGSGGSGGGGGTNTGTGGAGNTPSTSPSQGNNGGAGGQHNTTGGGGGGGGASAVGANSGSGVTAGGVGGAGTLNNIDGNGYYWAGGGGGSGHMSGTTAGAGGIGGGGGGGNAAGSAGVGDIGNAINNGAPGSGNGPGGNGGQYSGGGGGGSGTSAASGGSGGSGIVIIRYLS